MLLFSCTTMQVFLNLTLTGSITLMKIREQKFRTPPDVVKCQSRLGGELRSFIYTMNIFVLYNSIMMGAVKWKYGDMFYEFMLLSQYQLVNLMILRIFSLGVSFSVRSSIHHFFHWFLIRIFYVQNFSPRFSFVAGNKSELWKTLLREIRAEKEVPWKLTNGEWVPIVNDLR